MANSMYMDSEKLRADSTNLKNKIKEIEECYKAIDDIVKNIDGTNDNWFGDEQKLFYDYYLKLSKEFPKNLEKFNEFHTFLCGVIEEYEERDNDISKDIDANADNLDV